MQGYQKQKEQHASSGEAEGASCKGSKMSNMQEQQNHAEGEAGAAETEGAT